MECSRNDLVLLDLQAKFENDKICLCEKYKYCLLLLEYFRLRLDDPEFNSRCTFTGNAIYKLQKTICQDRKDNIKWTRKSGPLTTCSCILTKSTRSLILPFANRQASRHNKFIHYLWFKSHMYENDACFNATLAHIYLEIPRVLSRKEKQAIQDDREKNAHLMSDEAVIQTYENLLCWKVKLEKSFCVDHECFILMPPLLAVVVVVEEDKPPKNAVTTVSEKKRKEVFPLQEEPVSCKKTKRMEDCQFIHVEPKVSATYTIQRKKRPRNMSSRLSQGSSNTTILSEKDLGQPKNTKKNLLVILSQLRWSQIQTNSQTIMSQPTSKKSTELLGQLTKSLLAVQNNTTIQINIILVPTRAAEYLYHASWKCGMLYYWEIMHNHGYMDFHELISSQQQFNKQQQTEFAIVKKDILVIGKSMSLTSTNAQQKTKTGNVGNVKVNHTANALIHNKCKEIRTLIIVYEPELTYFDPFEYVMECDSNSSSGSGDESEKSGRQKRTRCDKMNVNDVLDQQKEIFLSWLKTFVIFPSFQPSTTVSSVIASLSQKSKGPGLQNSKIYHPPNPIVKQAVDSFISYVSEMIGSSSIRDLHIISPNSSNDHLMYSLDAPILGSNATIIHSIDSKTQNVVTKHVLQKTIII